MVQQSSRMGGSGFDIMLGRNTNSGSGFSSMAGIKQLEIRNEMSDEEAYKAIKTAEANPQINEQQTRQLPQQLQQQGFRSIPGNPSQAYRKVEPNTPPLQADGLKYSVLSRRYVRYPRGPYNKPKDLPNNPQTIQQYSPVQPINPMMGY
jgi:hypothetical protein